MVGLSVILEPQKGGFGKESSQVISKATVMINSKPSSSFSSSSSTSWSTLGKNSCFQAPLCLDFCYLCKEKLLPGKDIYMYKGDKGFCSVECRCRQIFMDEEESILKDNCSLAAMNPKTPSTSTSSSSSSSSAASRNRKSTRNRRGEFAY